MITWLAVKTFIKKAWVWSKKYWYIPAIVVYTFVVWVFSRKGGSASEILEIQNESHKAQLKAITDAHEEEAAKKDAALKKYNEIILSMEEQHKRDNKKLDNKKKKEVKRIIEEHGDNPERLAKMMSEKFGFTYIIKGETG